ncbi:MAG TPA: hypothetical protein PLN71_17990, partial [Anaerolineae bacterium]|nr:hypothetical protein [Anaerolineae bacterium]
MRPQFIRLFNLLLTFSLLLAGIGWTAAPSAARPLKVAVGPETPVRIPAAPHDLVPLPRDCGGTTPPACCAYGYVIRNGRALDG